MYNIQDKYENAVEYLKEHGKQIKKAGQLTGLALLAATLTGCASTNVRAFGHELGPNKTGEKLTPEQTGGSLGNLVVPFIR